MIFCALLVLFEAGLTFFLMEGDISLILFLDFHFGGMLLAYLFAHKKKGLRYVNLYLFAVALTTVAGVLGAAVGWLMTALALYNKRKLVSLPESMGLENREGLDQDSEAMAHLSGGALEGQAQVVPFLEVIKQGNNRQRIEALSAISHQYRPEFAPALLAAKESTDSSIRALAESTIMKVDQNFMERYKALSEKYYQDPKSLVVLLNIARHASAYADCGILDVYRQRHYREKAIDYFAKYLRERPRDEEAQLTLAKLYLKNGAPDKSVSVFQTLLKQGADLSFADIFWYVEALYDSGDIGLIRAQVRQFEKLGLLEGETNLFMVDDIFRPWAAGRIVSAKGAA